MSKFSIEKNLLINAPASLIFNALTNSDQIIQYYPLNGVISDWIVGSEVLYKGGEGDQKFTDYGKIDALIPNKKFQYTY
ncbi:MAG: hypothetical protein ACI86H_001121 [bacterium]|jgi:uncharacterized protein YndB with AHSA1/START domain